MNSNENFLKDEIQTIIDSISAKLTQEFDFNNTNVSQEQVNSPNLHNLIEQEVKNSPIKTANRIRTEFFDAGPLTELIQNPLVTEIFIQGEDSIWFEDQSGIRQWNQSFLSQMTYDRFVQKLLKQSLCPLDFSNPTVDCLWENFRVHIVGKPLSCSQKLITLRRIASSPWTFKKLLKNSWASETEIEYIQNLISEKKNFLIIGNTGSGKTSITQACLGELPSNERVILLQDTPELRTTNDISCSLVTRFDPNGNLQDFKLSDLVRQSLRMRPDRIILGEVRGNEAKDLILALSTGHNGSMCTLHANSPFQALKRLEILVQMGAPQWSINTIRSLIKESIDNLIHVESIKGIRRLKGIYELSSLESSGFLFQKIEGQASFTPGNQFAFG